MTVGLEWRDGTLPVLALTGVPGVRAAFTTRLGGVSHGSFASLNLGMATGDDVQLVAENRARAVRAAGGDPRCATGGYQSHGADVAEIETLPDGGFLDPEYRSPRADALVTGQPGTALVAYGADCLTALIWSPQAGRLAVAHAGWRGLVGGVLENAVAAAGPDAVCAVGPGAGPCCYAVREDVAAPLRARFGADVVGGGRADLWQCARRSLARAGAAEVVAADCCTICDPARFHSHRRDGAPGGRQALIALIEDAAA